MLFANRRRRGSDKYLPWKTGTLVAGVALILLGDRLGVPAFVWAAIVILLIGFLLRFLPQDRADEDADDEA